MIQPPASDLSPQKPLIKAKTVLNGGYWLILVFLALFLIYRIQVLRQTDAGIQDVLQYRLPLIAALGELKVDGSELVAAAYLRQMGQVPAAELDVYALTQEKLEAWPGESEEEMALLTAVQTSGHALQTASQALGPTTGDKREAITQLQTNQQAFFEAIATATAYEQAQLQLSLNDVLIARSNNRVSVIGGLVVWFIIILVLALTTRFVLNSFSNLTQAITQIGEGNLTIQLPQSRFTEFHELRYHFGQLGQRLQDLLTHLEQRVAERTAELATANENLHQAQIEAEAALEKAEAANEAKAAFLANMSHEIRTPLNGVLGMTALLQETALTPEQQEYANLIRQSGDSLLSIISDILHYIQLEARDVPLARQTFEVSSCVQSVLKVASLWVGSRKITLTATIDEQVPATVNGDAERLRQVLRHLLSNAIKFTEAGYVQVEVTGRPLSDDGRYELQFAIRDSGIGIAAEDIPHLFQLFSQVDDSSTRKYGGIGLGLSLSRTLIEAMGGRIWVESIPQQGSTFYFTIHVQTMTASSPIIHPIPPAEPSATAVTPMSPNHPYKILIVEDNAINQKLALRTLNKFGYEADLAKNGQEAITAVKRQVYDMVLMDIQMPEMDGLEATRRIRQEVPAAQQPYIIAVTANARPIDKVECLEAGMNDYITKPFGLQDLREALQKGRSHVRG